MFELEREGRAFLIAPQNTAHWHRTESDPEQLRQMYQQGYEEAMAQMTALRAYLGTDIKNAPDCKVRRVFYLSAEENRIDDIDDQDDGKTQRNDGQFFISQFARQRFKQRLNQI